MSNPGSVRLPGHFMAFLCASVLFVAAVADEAPRGRHWNVDSWLRTFLQHVPPNRLNEWLEHTLSMLPAHDIVTSVLDAVWPKFWLTDVRVFLLFATWCHEHGFQHCWGLDWEALRVHDPTRTDPQRKRDRCSEPFVDTTLSAEGDVSGNDRESWS